MRRLGDEDAVRHPDDPPGLAQHDLDLARVAVESLGERDGLRPGLDRRQVDGRAFRLRHDLLGDDQDVVVPQGQGIRCAVDRIADDRREVIALPDLGDAVERDDADRSHSADTQPLRSGRLDEHEVLGRVEVDRQRPGDLHVPGAGRPGADRDGRTGCPDRRRSRWRRVVGGPGRSCRSRGGPPRAPRWLSRRPVDRRDRSIAGAVTNGRSTGTTRMASASPATTSARASRSPALRPMDRWRSVRAPASAARRRTSGSGLTTRTSARRSTARAASTVRARSPVTRSCRSSASSDSPSRVLAPSSVPTGMMAAIRGTAVRASGRVTTPMVQTSGRRPAMGRRPMSARRPAGWRTRGPPGQPGATVVVGHDRVGHQRLQPERRDRGLERASIASSTKPSTWLAQDRGDAAGARFVAERCRASGPPGP